MCFVDGVAPQDSDANQTAQDTAHHNFIFIFEISNVIDPSIKKPPVDHFVKKGPSKAWKVRSVSELFWTDAKIFPETLAKV